MAVKVDIKVPQDNEEGTTMKVQSWLKKPGDVVAKNEPLVEMETDKVVLEIECPADGVLGDILVDVGADVTSGMLLGHIDTASSTTSRPSTPSAGMAPAQTANVNGQAEPKPAARRSNRTPNKTLSPAVKRFVLTNEIDPSTIVGTGANGRITLNDVKSVALTSTQKADNPKSDRGRATTASLQTTPPNARLEPTQSRRVQHTAMRRSIAKHMSSSLKTAPHVTAVFEADFSKIISHRAANKAKFANKGVKLTYTAYFLMACVQAMQTVPEVNSQWHDDSLEVFTDVNIGVGTALGNDGLIVPVVKNVQEKNLFGAAKALQDMTDRARTNKLSPEDVRGGTFTISNHGVSGSLVATPIIINQPQSAILGIGKLEKRVVVHTIDDQDVLAVKPMAYVSLSIDHRALDGHQTNMWLTELVSAIEGWSD